MQFQWSMPTRCFFGHDALRRHGEVLTSLGKRAMVVTGRAGAERSGALTGVTTLLDALGISWARFEQVEPNPSLETVLAGARATEEFAADFVIGIGGGSPMDAAKAIAALVHNRDPEALFAGRYDYPVLPVVAVPTTAGTGSEVTPYSILTDHGRGIKRSLSAPVLFPAFSFLDSRYLDTLPGPSLVNTVLDALSHAAEGFLARRATPLSDTLAMESLAIIGRHLAGLAEKERDPKLLDDLLYASQLAGMVIAQTGTTIAHGMGYGLTVHHEMDHGYANGAIFPAFLSFSMVHQPDRTTAILAALAMDGLEAFQDAVTGLLGPFPKIAAERLDQLAQAASQTANVHNTVPEPSLSDIRAMFTATFG